MRINFEGVSEGFEPIPSGTYEAVLTKADVVPQSKNSGQPYVNMEFTIDEGEYAGRKVWQMRSLQPQSLWAIKGDLVKLGAAGEALSGEVDIEEVLESVTGQSCRVKVTQEEYEGETRNRVNGLLAAELAF